MNKKKNTFIYKMKKEDKQELIEALKTHGRVKVEKFGIFELRKINGRVTSIINSDERIMTKGYTKIAFIPSRNLKTTINEAKVDSGK